MYDPKEVRARINGIDFVALEMGEGPLALCLHGFPDNAHTFRHQMPALAEAGYRAVSPFMRGYAPTSVAADGNYQLGALAHDIFGLIDEFGDGSAVVIGHDWGVLSAYCAAAASGTEKISKLVAMSIPYGPKFLESYSIDYDQLKRSWYIHFFQGPLADLVVPLDRCMFAKRLWEDWSPGWEIPEESIESVRDTLSAPGGVEAALGYYRALMDDSRFDPAFAAAQEAMHVTPIQVPTLYLHGDKDGCMGSEFSRGMAESFPGGFHRETLSGVGHFMHQEAPELINGKILDFLGKA